MSGSSATETLKLNDGTEVKVYCYTPEGSREMWEWRVGSDTGHADTRDDAIYYAGWWTGRRSLAADMSNLAEHGEPDDDD